MPPARVIVLSGELDIYAAPAARRLLDTIDGPAIIDISRVDLMCAAGLGELARVAKRVGYGHVTLAGPQPFVRRVLQIANFERLFLITDAPPESQA